MKKTRFVSQDKHEHEFAVALRKNVNNYFKENGISTKANAAVVFQVITMLSLYIVPFLILLFVPLPGWAAVLMPFIAGIGLAGTGMCVMHGGAHDALSSHKWMNKLMGGTMNLLGNSVFTWKVKHNMMHHTYTNIDGLDADILSKGPMRFSEQSPLKKVNRIQHFVAVIAYGLLTLSMLVNDFIWLVGYSKDGTLAKQKIKFWPALFKLIVIKSIHIFLFLVLPVLVTDYPFWMVFCGWLLMHWTGGFILSLVFQLAHVVEGVDQPVPTEAGIIENDWIVHELRTTANFAGKNQLLNWYIGGLNFQIEHHIFPNICHVHYPKIAPIVERTAKAYGYPYIQKKTFADALVSHVRKLKELGHVPPPTMG